MPLISSEDYKPPLILRSGQINTIYPYLFRKKQYVGYTRERIITPDDDFFDVDWVKNGNKRLAIMLHGLEGSSSSQYIIGTSAALIKNGWDVAAINFRSCSGSMNNTIAMYHSGFTSDVHYFISQKHVDYDEIFLCGFSLGGNAIMKYLGDQKYSLNEKIKASAGTSVPCDLEGGSIMIKKMENTLYERNFLKSLTQKIKLKHRIHPDKIDVSNLNKIKTLWDFDEYYTASLHGFTDARDYYNQCSSLQFLKNIKIPSLIINALDDTFLAKTSYPVKIAENSNFLHLMTPKYGGHVGFATFDSPNYWNENKILQFFSAHSQF